MVLSNKKLKQKLRAALAESLVVSVAGTTDPTTIDSTSTNPDPNPQSLKNLLGSATQIPRLSKREKRRKTLSLQGPELAGTSNQSEEKEANTEALTDDGNNAENKNKKKKKRKRDGEVDDGEVGLEENKNKLKKKKNKKKKKKKQKSEGQNKDVENEGGEKGVVKETAQISDSQENGDASNKVYVGGIPYYSTEDDIRSYFDSCGTITEVDCMTFPESGKFRGIAIISFKVGIQLDWFAVQIMFDCVNFDPLH
ncbi:hypothetical protein CK203_010286 [Vitis vinifera]|uniref:RRM domain-containing protein n=1 Tax=Vitis vinifera TaxID=29760 RepID=A0A438JY53_VITVI|nr:hypothetical protein CK203_010286 [Vitis vinifera]